jgi:hypothetical protein
MVAQEVWGMLLVHHAIRRLMHQAALDHRVDPDRLSFVRSLRVVRRQVTTTGQATIPPEPQARALARVTREIAERLLPTRRLRAFPSRGQTQDEQLRRQTRPPSRLAPTDAAPSPGSRHRRGVQAGAHPPATQDYSQSISQPRPPHRQPRTSRTNLSYRHWA